MRESEVFLMRNTKRELNPYSFYDTEGLARHFERMAAEGWAPDRVACSSATAALSRRSCASPSPTIPMTVMQTAKMFSSSTVHRQAGSSQRALVI